MKMWYVIAAGVIAVALVLLAAKGMSSSRASRAGSDADTSTGPDQRPKENPYSGLRDMALHISADDLELTPSVDVPYGVVVDWDMGDAIVTTVAFQTGDASIYLSSGQGFIGGSGHATVQNAAKALVRGSTAFVPKAARSSDTSLPTKAHVKFHLLTGSGHFVHEEPMAEIERGASAWRPLYDLCQEVITAYRTVTEKK